MRHDPKIFLQAAMAIGKLHFFPGQNTSVSGKVHHFHLRTHLADLAAVCAGIHIHTASLGVDDGQGGLACSGSWGRTVGHD